MMEIRGVHGLRRMQCKRLLEMIMRLREPMEGPGELGRRLRDLHDAFVVARHSFDIRRAEGREGERTKIKETAGGLEYWRVSCGDKEAVFLVFRERVVGIEGEHSLLERVFVGRRLEEAVARAWMYLDCNERPCDLCGRYYLQPYYEIPLEREEKEDFVMAYHRRCME